MTDTRCFTDTIDPMDGNRPLPFDRDVLGRMVREAWVRWAQTQPNPKPTWLVPYADLDECDREADRQIGEAVARWTLVGDAARASLCVAQACPDCGGEGHIQTHADGRGIECPNCHNANKYGDYEGPTCEVCMGDGFVAAQATLRCFDCGRPTICPDCDPAGGVAYAVQVPSGLEFPIPYKLWADRIENTARLTRVREATSYNAAADMATIDCFYDFEAKRLVALLRALALSSTEGK